MKNFVKRQAHRCPHSRFCDNPRKGYAIFAENMLETALSVSEQQLKEAS